MGCASTRKQFVLSKTTIYGEERAIRGDEYIVHTPWILSQVNNGFPIINKDIRSTGQSMTMTNVPTFSIDLLAKPYFGALYF